MHNILQAWCLTLFWFKFLWNSVKLLFSRPAKWILDGNPFIYRNYLQITHIPSSNGVQVYPSAQRTLIVALVHHHKPWMKTHKMKWKMPAFGEIHFAICASKLNGMNRTWDKVLERSKTLGDEVKSFHLTNSIDANLI